MKQRFYLKIFQFIFLVSCTSVANGQLSIEDKLKQHVYTLADDSLAGRKAGSEYTRKAAVYITAQWNEIGLKPLVGNTYLRPFQLGYFYNLAAIIEGNDPILKDEYIIVGAHYDHIGGFVNNKGETIINNGADDNASGVATLIELGRLLKEKQSTLRRSVVLIAFDAEELGLFGSSEFAVNPPFPAAKIKLMMSVDMVGWYKISGYVKYSGVGTLHNVKNLILEGSLKPEGLHVKTQEFERSIFTATDTKSFAETGIPTLCITTGSKSPYHKPEDMAHLIDYEGMTLITEHLANVVQVVSQNDDIRASGKISSKHKNKKIIFGVSSKIGYNYHNYTAGALNGKKGTVLGVGMNGQLNMNYIALRPEVFYDYITARHPQGQITTHAFTIPFNLFLQTPSSAASGLAVFAGPYYSCVFKGKQGDTQLDFDHFFHRDEAGYNFGIEIRVANIRSGVTFRNAFTNFSRTTNAENGYIHNKAVFFTLGYTF